MVLVSSKMETVPLAEILTGRGSLDGRDTGIVLEPLKAAMGHAGIANENSFCEGRPAECRTAFERTWQHAYVQRRQTVPCALVYLGVSGRYLRQARDMEAIRYLDDGDGNCAVATAQGAFEVEGDDAVHLHGDGHRGPCHQRDVSQPSTCRAASSALNNKPKR